MKSRSIIAYVSLFVLAISACKHLPEEMEEDPNGQGSSSNPTAITCDEDSIYFEQQILPLFQSNCAMEDCHDVASHEDGIILDSYSNIINTGDIEPGDLDAGDIYEVITETDPDDIMPPSPNDPLTSDEIDLIANWIMQGAVENSCSALYCDTLEVTFAADIMPLIATFCEGCHSGANPGAGISLTNHGEVQSIGSDGSLMGTINWENGFEPMPQNADQLSACQIRMFEIWIENGMPND